MLVLCDVLLCGVQWIGAMSMCLLHCVLGEKTYSTNNTLKHPPFLATSQHSFTWVAGQARCAGVAALALVSLAVVLRVARFLAVAAHWVRALVVGWAALPVRQRV